MNFLRRALLALLCIAASIAVAQTQTPASPQSKQSSGQAQAKVKKSPLVPFVANWYSLFNGKPWLLLSLNLSGEQFSGSLQRSREFAFKDNGDLKSVSDDILTYQLIDAKLTPDGLLLAFKDPDKPKPQRYMMKLTGDSTAEIKMIEMVMPPGMPKPNPWKLTKVQ